MKRALVTGGSGGIGAAICKELATSGYHVIVHANRNLEKAEIIVAQILKQGSSAEACQFDITDFDATDKALTKLLIPGPIQCLVHNAGIHNDAPLVGMSPQQWRSVLDVSLQGFYNITQPLLMPMMRTRWGRIVSLSSIAARMGNRGQANYAAAKAGLEGATRSLALEVASRGITVNAIAPGIIETTMTESTFSEAQVKAMVPMNRTGTPAEVAKLTAFLCSDDAGYISGQTVAINGAMSPV